MADLFLLSEAQMRRIKPYFPLSHGIARVDDRRVISGIVFVIRNGLRWRDAPRDYGPHRRSTIGSCAGAASASSTKSSRSWRARPASRPGL
jgi:transposase